MGITADLSDQCFSGNSQSIAGTDDVAQGSIFTSKTAGKLSQSTAESVATIQSGDNINESPANIQWCSVGQELQSLTRCTSRKEGGQEQVGDIGETGQSLR